MGGPVLVNATKNRCLPEGALNELESSKLESLESGGEKQAIRAPATAWAAHLTELLPEAVDFLDEVVEEDWVL